jgi:hypothetical protein
VTAFRLGTELVATSFSQVSFEPIDFVGGLGGEGVSLAAELCEFVGQTGGLGFGFGQGGLKGLTLFEVLDLGFDGAAAVVLNILAGGGERIGQLTDAGLKGLAITEELELSGLSLPGFRSETDFEGLDLGEPLGIGLFGLFGLASQPGLEIIRLGGGRLGLLLEFLSDPV